MQKVSNQETFNKVWKHLKEQGKPAITPNGDCRYRTNDGLKCAVGCLIKDEYYYESFEGQDVEGLLDEWDEISLYSYDLLLCLQVTHDNWRHFSDEWFWGDMREIAREFNLSVPND